MDGSPVEGVEGLSCRFTGCHVYERSSSAEVVEDSHDADVGDFSKHREEPLQLRVGHLQGQIEDVEVSRTAGSLLSLLLG